ncbi:hypothetical protein NL533_35360, partial [Klebsiella pneumoniae]|nr:hypothetical protein [Klebsiella pneumoniae]
VEARDEEAEAQEQALATVPEQADYELATEMVTPSFLAQSLLPAPQELLADLPQHLRSIVPPPKDYRLTVARFRAIVHRWR